MSHSHEVHAINKSLIIGLVLNGSYTILGFVFGIITGSLTLIADAIHNLTDNLTLGVSFVANRISTRKADAMRTFGYGRVTIIAAVINASFLIGVAIVVIMEAIERLKNPVEIQGGVVAAVAFCGIIVNATVAYMLSKNRQDLNMRSAFIDQLFDAISSFGAFLAGIIIMMIGIQYIDTIIALLVVILLIYNTIKILKEATNILLEGVPEGINLSNIKTDIRKIPKVIDVDDVHVWAIRSGYSALSCHVVVDKNELKNSREIVEKVKTMLQEKHEIKHATIEIELETNTHAPGHERH